MAANTTDRQTGAFLLGMTIVGAPIAFELEKAKQREVYKVCMEEKGYRVVPTNDSGAASSATTAVPPPPVPTAVSHPVITPEQPKPTLAIPPLPPSQPVASPPRDEAAQLQKLRELRDKGLITEVEYERKRKEILDRL